MVYLDRIELDERERFAPYRTEPEPLVLSDTVEVDRKRLIYLRRCEEILDTLETRAEGVEFHEFSKYRWTVTLRTGEYVDMYPVWATVDAKCLTTAVEDALGWEPVDYMPPPPKPSKSSARTVFWSAFWGAFWLLTGCFLLYLWN